jgi:hypothetical protein
VDTQAREWRILKGLELYFQLRLNTHGINETTSGVLLIKADDTAAGNQQWNQQSRRTISAQYLDDLPSNVYPITLERSMPPLTTNRAATITDAGSGLKPGLPLHTRSPFNSGPQHSIVLDTDPVVGAEFIPVFTAPFHLGQGGCAQMFLVALVDLIGRCIAQADVKNRTGFEGLGRLEAQAASAVIEGHGRIFAVKLGAEGRDNKWRMRPDAFIFPLIGLNPRLVDFFIRLEFAVLLDCQ